MIKTFTTTLILFSLTFNAFSQTTVEIDERLYDVFDAKYLETLQEKNPFLIQYYNFYLDNAYQIAPIAEGKEANFKTVEIEDVTSFNILKIQQDQSLTRSYEQQTYYKIKGKNKLLILRSEKDFARRLNQHLGRTN